MHAAALARRNAADDMGSIVQRARNVKCRLCAGDTLANHFSIFTNQN